MRAKLQIENPLLPHRTLNFVARRYKLGAVTRILPWRVQPEVKEAPIVRLQGRWTNFLYLLNFALAYLIFIPAAIFVSHGILFLGWGSTQQQFSLLSLGALGLPIVASLALMHESDCLELTRESWKHITYLQHFFQAGSVYSPKLVLRSQIAMKAVNYMTYSNTLSVAMASIVLPWLPLLRNISTLAVGSNLQDPWRTAAKMFDFGFVCYMGHYCAEHAFVVQMVAHCFCVCNTIVIRDLMSPNPKLVDRALVDQCDDVLIGIWRRIQILNIGFNTCFGVPLMAFQTAAIVIASAGAFAAIKTNGFISAFLGSLAIFIVLILFTALKYTSLLGEAMVEMKAKLERKCRGNALLRRQIRSLRPAFITAGSFYYIDKGCILTCGTIIIDNVVNALMMANM